MREGKRDKRKGRSEEGSKRLRLCQKHGREEKIEHRQRMRGAQNDAAETIVIKHLGETQVSTRMWMRVREEPRRRTETMRGGLFTQMLAENRARERHFDVRLELCQCSKSERQVIAEPARSAL